MVIYNFYYIEIAPLILHEHGSVLHESNIRMTFGPTGELYCLPIYVINPPLKYAVPNSDNNDNIPVVALSVIIIIRIDKSYI